MASLINIALGMSFNKGVLNAVVGDFNKVQTSSNGASKSVKGFGDSLTKIGHVQSLAAAGNILNSVMGSLKGFKAEFDKQFNVLSDFTVAGDRIAKTSRLVGLSVHDYQAFSSAAQHSGMSIDEMDNALKRFNVNLGKAKSGDAKSLKMFDAILGGKSVSDFATSSDLIAGIADGYMKLSSAEQKSFVSQELFGKGCQKISELFKDGGESLKQYVNGYDAAFSEDGASKAEQFNDSLQDMRETIYSVKVSVAQELFPAFRELFDSVKDFFKSSDGDEFKKSLRSVGLEIAGIVKDLLPAVPKILKGILSVVNFIGPKVTLIGGIVGSMIPMFVSLGLGLSAITGVAASTLVPVLGLVVAAVALWGSVIKDVYDNWDMLKSFIVDDVWGGIKQFFNNCIDSVKNWVAMAIADFQWLWDGFKSIFVDPILNFIDALPQAFSDLWDGFKTGAMAAVSTVKDLLKRLPLVGNLFGDSNSGNGPNGGSTSPAAPSQIASAVQQSYSVTTNRFAVDFNNVPRGTNITPPPQGDFDWSRSYTLAGAV